MTVSILSHTESQNGDLFTSNTLPMSMDGTDLKPQQKNDRSLENSLNCPVFP